MDECVKKHLKIYLSLRSRKSAKYVLQYWSLCPVGQIDIGSDQIFATSNDLKNVGDVKENIYFNK